MFAAYFDDSGTHDDTGTSVGSEIVVAAGYVATPSVWEAFALEWNTLLASKGLEYYHSVDCNAQRGQFDGWEIPDCNQLHKAFVEVIVRHPIIAIGYATAKAPFNESYRATEAGAQLAPKAAYFNSLLNAWKL